MVRAVRSSDFLGENFIAQACSLANSSAAITASRIRSRFGAPGGPSFAAPRSSS